MVNTSESGSQLRDSSHMNLIVPEKRRVLERFNLTEHLVFPVGDGKSNTTYGEIIQGVVPSEGRDVAVAAKCFRFTIRDDIKLLLENEVYVWKELKHHNILPLLGFAFDKLGYPLLLSPWMSNGSSLDFVVAHPDCDLMHLIGGIARGLAYIHDLDMVHSDIKPDNILISDNKDALISDFGCSRMVAASDSLDKLSAGVAGPPQYSAHELLINLEQMHTKKTDVWAFGMTVYELLVGQRAYADTKAYLVAIMISRGRLPSFPSTTHPSISPEMSKVIWDICQSCWKTNPMERADMKVILEMLTPKLIVSGPEDEQGTDQATNLHSIVPEILADLKHLDLSDSFLFKETRVIGGGAYGDVCKGHCRMSGRGVINVAVKTMRFYLKEDIKMLFEQEIYVWAKLKHPNILPLLGYAFDTQTGYPLLVSEWIENGSAWNFVITHPNCDLMRIVAGMARGLAYLHKKGVVHSDVKSDNVLVSNAGDALVCDFGLSRMVAASRTFANLKTSEVKGTAHYLAYELVTNSASKHSAKTDVWAFGMTVLELLTRQRPYATTSIYEAQVLLAIQNRELPEPPSDSESSPPPEVKQKLWEICQLCWMYDPDNRIDMDSIVKMLVGTDVA